MLNSIFGLDSVQAIAAPVLEGPEVVRVVLNSSSTAAAVGRQVPAGRWHDLFNFSTHKTVSSAGRGDARSRVSF